MVTAKANLMVEALNLMGYNAMGIGDDDLTLGKEFLISLSKKANFPFLCSNLVDGESGKVVFQSHIIKEVNGLRVGIFGLISPDTFSGLQDPRLKGMKIQNPVETAQRIIKELKPNTDLIILLSHLSYPKDSEMAQAAPGIQIIVGGHTGVSLTYPPIVKDTVILHTPPRAMYAGRFALAFLSNDAGVYNVSTKRSFENNLANLKLRLTAPKTSPAEKEQYERFIADTERSLKQLQGKNEFSNFIVPLNESFKEQPEISKLIEDFNKTFVSDSDKSSSPKH
jgi:2',3'-cyclic-nucleotide 2'-phosphodiesterase (5'-nucleotidase family)